MSMWHKSCVMLHGVIKLGYDCAKSIYVWQGPIFLFYLMPKVATLCIFREQGSYTTICQGVYQDTSSLSTKDTLSL